MTWLLGLAAVGGSICAVWFVLVLLARRLPDGTMRQVARFLPDCVTTVRRLLASDDVPRSAKIALGVAVAWVISPIDLIPEFLPVIGPLDDALVVALVLRYVARRVPAEVVLDAWPGDPQLIARLLGTSPRDRGRRQQTLGR